MTPSSANLTDHIRSSLLGLAVGDALGVPVEFKSRSTLKQNPVKDMRGYGSHGQPAGTWSDDSSLAFCLAEVLSVEFDLHKIASNFVDWKEKGYWTPHGIVFDIGIATTKAINKLKHRVRPDLAGYTHQESYGNGSLMRILPLLFYIKDKPLNERFGLTKLVSSITHAQMQCVIGCFYYLEFARLLINLKDKLEVYAIVKKTFPKNLESIGVALDEVEPYDRLLTDDIFTLKAEEIESGGYVVETLEASVWCLMTTDSYTTAVLKAVNLGEDTDTTAAITGGLAGLLYGYEQIPGEWIEVLARKDDIEDLCRRFASGLEKQKK